MRIVWSVFVALSPMAATMAMATPIAAQGSASAQAGASAGICSGPRARRMRPKVVNGWHASRQDWPGFVALRLYNEDNEQTQYICGGSLIAPRWVLTAAHCFDAFDEEQPENKPDAAKTTGKTSRLERYVGANLGFQGQARLQVELATDDLRTFSATRIAEVERIRIHPRYGGPETAPTRGNDIALIELASAWPGPFSRLSLAVGVDPPTPPGTRAMAAGFGNLRDGQPAMLNNNDHGAPFTAGSTLLQEVDLPTVAEPDCASVYKGYAIGAGQICAGYPGGQKDSCHGDSGGPLVAFDNHGCPFQIGVVSWGNGCANADAYGVYSRISYFAPWITSMVKDPLLTVSPAEVTVNTDKQALKALSQSALAEIGALVAPASDRVVIRLQRYLDRQPIPDNVLSLNERYLLTVTSSVAGRLILFDLDASGDLTQIFPNEFVNSEALGQVAKGTQVLIPGPGYNFDWFRAADPVGKSHLFAIVVPDDFPYSTLAANAARIEKGKGVKAEAAPVSYLSTLLDQIYKSVSSRNLTKSAMDGWAFAAMEYEIR